MIQPPVVPVSAAGPAAGRQALGIAAAGGGQRAAGWSSAPAPLHRQSPLRLALPCRLFKKEPTTKEVARSTQRDIAHNVRDLERCVPPAAAGSGHLPACLPAFLPSVQGQPLLPGLPQLVHLFAWSVLLQRGCQPEAR